jgi:hypothetical protein
MAMDTLHGIGGSLAALDDVMHEIAVTAKTTPLKDRRVARMNHNRLMEILKGKASRMTIPIVSLGKILRDKRMGQMAIDTHRGGVVRAFRPGRVLIIHDVAVGARSRVGREISEPPGIVERKHSDAAHQPGKARNNNKNPHHIGFSQLIIHGIPN